MVKHSLQVGALGWCAAVADVADGGCQFCAADPLMHMHTFVVLPLGAGPADAGAVHHIIRPSRAHSRCCATYPGL